MAADLDWTPDRQARLHGAARLHDVGKLALPSTLLGRPGPLSADEALHVGQHARIGAALAARVLDAEQESWIAAHHVRWDDTTAPPPDGAALVAVADAWDAMTNDGCYRPRLTRAGGARRAGARRVARPAGARTRRTSSAARWRGGTSRSPRRWARPRPRAAACGAGARTPTTRRASMRARDRQDAGPAVGAPGGPGQRAGDRGPVRSTPNRWRTTPPARPAPRRDARGDRHPGRWPGLVHAEEPGGQHGQPVRSRTAETGRAA